MQHSGQPHSTPSKHDQEPAAPAARPPHLDACLLHPGSALGALQDVLKGAGRALRLRQPLQVLRAPQLRVRAPKVVADLAHFLLAGRILRLVSGSLLLLLGLLQLPHEFRKGLPLCCR